MSLVLIPIEPMRTLILLVVIPTEPMPTAMSLVLIPIEPMPTVSTPRPGPDVVPVWPARARAACAFLQLPRAGSEAPRL